MSVVADRLSLRWYLGYDLYEALPDHSSLTRIRERYGLGVFRYFFERIIEMCFEAGLVQGRELYFDATKVEANASLDSTRSRSLVESYLEGIFPSEESGEERPVEEFAQEANAPGSLSVIGPADSQKREALAKTNAGGHRWIAGTGRQQREVLRWGYRRMADLRASTTDPDASPMQSKNKGASRPGYLTHYVVDGGKARVILDVLVTPAEVTENLPMRELLFRESCSLEIVSVGACGPARSPAMPLTARQRTWRPWRRPASEPTWCCPNMTNVVPCLASTSSFTTRKGISTSARRARPCAAKATTTRRDPSGTLPGPPPARRVRSGPDARRARRRDAG
jgi:IS5 family transposase